MEPGYSHADLIARALATPGGHLSIGHAGFALRFDRGATLSGYDCDRIKEECVAAGLPVIDSREVAFADLWRVVVGGPMAAVGRPPDPPPWHPLSDAPLHHVAALHRAIGAEIINLPEGA